MSRLPQPGSKSGLRAPSAGRSRLAQPSASSISSPRPGPSSAPDTTPAVIPTRPASMLQKRVFQQALTKSVADPHHQVQAMGAQQSRVKTPTVMTRHGPEKVIQQMTIDKSVQRTPRAEYISKTLTGVDVGRTGPTTQVEVTSQRIDPRYATESAGVNETVSVTSQLSITASGKYQNTSVKKRLVKSQALAKKPNLNPNHVNRLVREENEDVENTLRIAPPELVSTAAIDKLPIKRKLANLRINSESMALLQRNVMRPVPTADEVETEAPPEVLASIIEAVEKGATPQSDPNQIFNTLFPQVQDERVELSSVAPGPLQDIVIPTEMPKESTEKSFTDEMRKTITEVQNIEVHPRDDICVTNKIQPAKRTSKATKKKPVVIKAEIPPWGQEDIQNLSPLVGGQPIFKIKCADVTLLEDPADCSKELSKGIDFFLDADTIPYENKVQLRGSKPPAWFPGYMAAFPHLEEIVRVNKSPSGVLQTAWRTVQPKMFPEDSILVG